MTGSFMRGCGVALILAALLTLGLNVFLTPLLPDAPFGMVAASYAYLIRQILASLVTLLLAFGIIGVHFGRPDRAGILATLTFIVALTGTICVFALEAGQAAMLHPLAVAAPDAVSQVVAAKGGPLAIGASIAILGFSGGWIFLALSLFLSKQYSRIGAALIIAGFVLSPVVGALGIFGDYAKTINALVIGSGWVMVALPMIRQAPSR